MKPTEKQIDYAKHISEMLGIKPPNFSDRYAVGAFIHAHKDAAQIKQEEYNQNLYERIKREVKIVDVAKEMGYTIKRDGRYYTFAEHDSVHINPENNLYIRSSEPGNRGSVIDFVQNFGNMGKQEAIEMLASRIGEDRGYTSFVPAQPAREKITFTLPDRGQNMKNVYAYLTQSRYIDPDVVQYFVDRKMLYQDTRKNCVFVSYKDEQPVFGCMKGTNTFTPFRGDIPGSDYTQCWFLDNGAEKLYVTEAPIDTMSKMSMFLKLGEDLQDYDYLALSGTGKYETVLHHAKDKNYTEIIIGTDNDKYGRMAFDTIRNQLSEQGIAAQVRSDFPKLTKDWNEELKYLFMKGYRYENYFEPTDSQLDLLNRQMQALAEGNVKQYQTLQMQLPQMDTTAELRGYMIDYLDKNYDKAMTDLESGDKRSIKTILKNYNKQMPLKTAKLSPKLDRGLDL